MKKYFLSLVAMAAMLFATSCQESLVEPQIEGPTTFTVQLPDQMGTKAIGDASSVTELLVDVYAQDGTAPIYQTKVTPNGNNGFDVQLNLIQDQAYDILFWAQTANGYVEVDGDETNGYLFGSLREVPMNSNYLNNDNGAAFFHAEKGFVPSGTSTTITLVRPFAQLNLGTTDGSLDELSTGKVKLLKSLITIKGVATNFNVYDGIGYGLKDVVYVYGPEVQGQTEKQPVDVPKDPATLTIGEVPTTQTFNYVSMNYLAVLGDTKAVVDVDAKIIVEDPAINGEERTIKHSFKSVPVQENYRTNIVGNLISSSTDFNVVVDADFAKDENGQLYPDNDILVVENAAAAQAALDNAIPGDVIELVAGVNYGTLKFRANPNHINTTLEDIADAWRYNYNRSIEDITIIGAEGATVDQFKFETGALPGDCNNRVTVNNLVIDGVEFTDALTASSAGYNAPIMITTTNATIDGLTVKNCKFIGNNNKLNLVYLYGADGSKNVSLINNKVEGIARLCELRGTENVTLTGNVIKNTYEHAMLLAGGGYAGNVTITGNTADGIRDRFVRMAGAGNAEVVIKDNYIYNYQGADADYIKVTDGSNVTIENNVLMVTSAVDLQSRVNSAAKGLNEFGFANDITGNVTIPQNDKINIVINGLRKKYDGTITVNGNQRSGGSETLVIKNINFEHSGSDLYFVEQNIAQNYPHNVIVEDCTFKGDGTSVIGGIRYRQGFNNVVKNCTAEDLFLFIWTTGGNNITIDNVDVIGYIEGGFSLGQCNEFTVKNSSIVASNHSGYGIRLSASMLSTATIENCEISSFIPVVVREASKDQTLTFNGTNIMTASNTDNIWCAIGTSAYNTNGTMPTPATGKVTVVLNDTGLNQAGVYGDYRPVAKIGETVYTSLGEAVKASTSTDEIILTDDAELVYTITNPYAPAKTINASVIDLNGKTMTIKDTDLRFNNTTIKNGKIVVAPGSYGGTAIFFQFNDLTFNDVEITATGLAGTYLIGLEGNSNLNLFDSQIIIDNENLVNLTAAVACNGSGSTIVENSNIYVKNINGRAFLNTSCSVVNSEVTADYVKAGFYIPAGKTLSINANSIVTITNLVDGKVNGIDLYGNAIYNVEDGATVNATVGRN